MHSAARVHGRYHVEEAPVDFHAGVDVGGETMRVLRRCWGCDDAGVETVLSIDDGRTQISLELQTRLGHCELED